MRDVESCGQVCANPDPNPHPNPNPYPKLAARYVQESFKCFKWGRTVPLLPPEKTSAYAVATGIAGGIKNEATQLPFEILNAWGVAERSSQTSDHLLVTDSRAHGGLGLQYAICSFCEGVDWASHPGFIANGRVSSIILQYSNKRVTRSRQR